MSEWRPIETAPKDGTPVLAFQPTYFRGRGGIVVACWQENSWWDNASWKIEPTHWMPLPAPPRQRKGLSGHDPRRGRMSREIDGIAFVDEWLRIPVEVCSEPLRVRTVRRQLDEMERIREFVLTLPMHDRKRWVAALSPLTEALQHDLAAQEGTGTLGAVLLAGYTLTDRTPPDSETNPAQGGDGE